MGINKVYFGQKQLSVKNQNFEIDKEYFLPIILKHIFSVPILLIAFFFSSCDERKELSIDYNTLSEAEKRLADNALSSMEVADGLQLELFASEPLLANPTNIAVDAKGRIWVCEGRNYRDFANPNISYDNAGDRILILEDVDGDGLVDTSKVFYQGKDVNSALGIAVLGTKVIVSASPNVLIFSDEDGDDVPESKEVIFTGIEGVDHDHGIHAFVFGPDGRLYFNFGNNGKKLLDKYGKPLWDIYGNEIKADGNPFREGMTFRMEMDGSNIEILGHNFRNPYEVAIDSYGGLWQSDNDDDGNRGTRINYLMEYGNYGYKDLMTGKDWRERRPGWEEEIPERHWHLNDPGTVPNLLQTGSGSPCGILVYEDNLLPEKYRGQLIHAEPGHNVVRSYVVEEKESGYQAKIINLVKSKDNWFRPDDVAVAPDGSVFISDWYDGGVGGHKVDDIERGRIFRLSMKKGYESPTFDFSTGAGAAKGLLSGNMDVFYRSWNKLRSMGVAAEPLLKDLIDKGGTAKARALWLGARLSTKKGDYINLAISDSDSKFRVLGIRMARYLAKDELEYYLSKVIKDNSSQVRREAAIALAHLGTPKAAELWASLAEQHSPGDRWYLEALGIGSDNHPDLYFNEWKKKVGDDWSNEKGREIVWRMRAIETTALLAKVIREEKVEAQYLPSYFRAFDFKEHPQKNAILFALLTIDHPNSQQIQALTLGALEEDYVSSSSKNIKIVKNLLPNIYGTPEWLMAIKKLKLKEYTNALFDTACNGKDASLQKEALSMLFNFGGSTLVRDYILSDAPEPIKMGILGMMGSISNPEVIGLLVEFIKSERLNNALTQRAVESIGNTNQGQYELFTLLEEEKIPESHKTAAILKLMTSWDEKIKLSAQKLLNVSESGNLDLEALVERTGNMDRGKEIFSLYCSVCHLVGDKGMEFGPSLSDIGNKLSKKFLYSNIIYPSAGINFGYEGYTIKIKDGSTFTGYILNQTENEVTIRMMGGNQQKLAISDIVSQQALEKSLMTEGLHKVMSEQDLVDLVSYLETLKIEE